MVESRIAQGGVNALVGNIPEVRVAQGGVYALISTGVPMRVAQAGINSLTAVIAETRVAQAGVLVLADGAPCLSRWCQIWQITRPDGEEFLFTSLNRDFTWLGNTYQSCDSLNPSAAEAVARLDEAGNMDLSGAIGPDGITEEDLFAGLFDGALVEVWLVPYLGEGRPRRLIRGTFGGLDQTDVGFKVELLGHGARLLQTPLIRLLQPDCRWIFGDDHCQKDLTGLTVSGTVDSGSGVREFTDAARTEAAGYFRRGRVTFTSGSNAGITFEIKSHAAGGVFTLWPRAAYRIDAGDQYDMEPGCSNLDEIAQGTNGCEAWGQRRRYGGFRKVPGSDRRSAPSVATKSPGP